MGAHDNGGPAFLSERGVVPMDNGRGHHHGMTLRDYFIAHAPAEPQTWFEPNFPEPPKPVKRPADITESERQELQGLLDGFLDVEDCKEVRVIAYENARIEQKKAGSQWSKDRERARYIQWPAAWADAMLAARKEGGAA